jgi:Ca-activated chloride channel homolog
MTRSTLKFASILGIALAGAAGILAFGEKSPTELAAVLGSREPLHVAVATSITKQKWLESAARAFEAAGETTESGRPIAIDVSGVLSGDSMLQISKGLLKPAAWSPGETSWVTQLNESWKSQTGHAAATQPCRPTAYTPLGIAIWRPMAEALGWPKTKISWKMLIELAGDPQGWSRYGHPEWGNLKLGYSHPQYSSAGLLFLASAIQAVIGKTGVIATADVYQPAVETALRQLAKNTYKYGLSSVDLLNLMASNGPQYLHAVSAFEQAVVQLNVERGNELRWPMAFVFPEEGTYWSDHPYCVLDGLTGMDAESLDVARRFGDFLRQSQEQARATENYVRPLDASLPVDSVLSLANGTDPTATPKNVPPLQIPDSAASKAIIDLFLATKRKATVMVAVDVSGSMTGEAIRAATEATRQFLSRLQPQDRVGLVAFNQEITTVTEIRPVAEVGERLASQVLNLVASGGTNLNGAVCEGLNRIRIQQKADATQGDNRLYGLVVLSDGADTAGAVSENRMFETCLPSGPETASTRVFTIAFGKDANRDVLQRIGQVSGGASFTADSRSIENVYLKISAEQ